MADENDDEWLYGNSDANATEEEGSNAEAPDSINDKNGDDQNIVLEPPVIPPLQKSASNDSEEQNAISSEINEDGEETNENDAANKDAEEGETPDEEKEKAKESDEEEDDDDNINVVIGDLRTTPGYGAGLHIKRGNLLTLTKQPGKFNVEDFDSVGTVNGSAAHEFNLDALEDKPWRKPGADISDYFNYGFNEDTWKAYCERQKRMRIHESGSGLIPLTQQPSIAATVVPTLATIPQVKPIPQERVIALNNMQQVNRPNFDIRQDSVIQVMTADRREYGSRKGFPQDMSVPPPMIPPPYQAMQPVPPPFMSNAFGGPSEYYSTTMDPYYQPSGYSGMHEPWMGPRPQEWNNANVISLANSNVNAEMPEPAVNGKSDILPGNVKIKQEPEDDYPTDRERDRERERDRHRERSHRRSRSRSRDKKSRKHKSRSRSPFHRSHKKKKSKKSDRRSKEGSSD